MDHDIALIGLLCLPIVVVGFLLAADVAARRNVQAAVIFMRGYLRSSAALKAAALAMAMAAAIHASMVFTHYADQPVLAVMFAGYSVALAALCIAVFVTRRGIPLALLVLASGLVAYAIFVASGREVVDTIGLMSKLIEGSALLLLTTIPAKKEVIYA